MPDQTTVTYLDSYCERAGMTGVFAEPVNAITNVFFIAAALAALYLVLRLPKQKWKAYADYYLLAVFLFGIGVGSGLWHTYPSKTTVLMDVIPITLFINLYLISAMRRLLRYSWNKIAGYWLLYTAVTMTMQLTIPPGFWNGTIMYIPTYLALVMLTVAVSRTSRYVAKVFLGMLFVWTVSLLFRTFDHEICGFFTSGTHFLWHSLNAVVLYRLLVVLIRHRPAVAIPAA